MFSLIQNKRIPQINKQIQLIKTKNERNPIMKTLTKIFAMALTFIMVLSLATAAFAVDVTISVINSESGASVTGHEYKVYQIFTGTVAADGVTLSDIVAGESLVDNADVDAILAAIKDMDGATAAEYLKNNDLLGDVFAELNDDKGFSVTAPAGYYLIIDDSKDLPATETASAVILQVLEDVAIHSKHDSSPIILKKVDDINDSNTSELEIQWHDSADHDIGDEIPFQLTAVLPSSFDAFELAGQKYPFTFHDTEEIGLAYIADSAKAYYVDDEGKKVEISTEQYSIVEDA